MDKAQRSNAVVLAACICAATSAFAQTASPRDDLRRPDGARSASEIIGAPVRSADGKEIGEVEDLIFSGDARVVTAVVSVGGLADIGDKLVAVPYADLRAWRDDRTLAIPLTSAEIDAAPAYKGDPPAVGDAQPLVDPVRAAPPDEQDRREASEEAAKAFAGDDPRVADGIAENKKAYEDEEPASEE